MNTLYPVRTKRPTVYAEQVVVRDIILYLNCCVCIHSMDTNINRWVCATINNIDKGMCTSVAVNK